jgi:hypothetical protein
MMIGAACTINGMLESAAGAVTAEVPVFFLPATATRALPGPDAAPKVEEVKVGELLIPDMWWLAFSCGTRPYSRSGVGVLCRRGAAAVTGTGRQFAGSTLGLIGGLEGVLAVKMGQALPLAGRIVEAVAQAARLNGLSDLERATTLPKVFGRCTV